MITLRPHHLFCVLGFRGKGYNPEFTENMGRISKMVKADDRLPIKVCFGPDDICALCPHLKDGKCSWGEAGEEVVQEHDMALVRAFGLEEGKVVTTAKLLSVLKSSKSVREVVFSKCDSCPWKQDCGFFEGLLAQSNGQEAF
jgi:hypothetical protein